MQSRLSVAGWVLYDFANSSFQTLIITVAYGVYFKQVVVPKETGLGDLYWGLSLSLSMLLVAASSPILGAIADASAAKKRFLGTYAGFCILFTGLLYLVQQGDILLGVLFLVLANIGFEGSLPFYNALLPEIAKGKDFGKVSGYGWGIGYLGGMLCLLWTYPLLRGGFAPDNLLQFRQVFVHVALFYALFSLPVLLWSPERARVGTWAGWGQYARQGWGKLRETFSQIRRYKNLLRFLLSAFLYDDAMATVVAFSAIYAVSTLSFSMADVVALWIIGQVPACVGALGSGFVVDRFGAKPTIVFCLLLWCAVVLGVYFAQTQLQFYVVAAVGAIGLGSVQSASRSLMALLTPRGKSGEFFGFYALCGKVSAILGPTTFGAISSVTGNQRVALLSVLFFFLAGLFLLAGVQVKRVED